MKRSELKKCACCNQGVANGNNLMFYKVDISHMIINLKAVNEISSMESFFEANVALANVMGTNPDIAKAVGTWKLLICQNCFIGSPATNFRGVDISAIVEDQEAEPSES